LLKGLPLLLAPGAGSAELGLMQSWRATCELLSRPVAASVLCPGVVKTKTIDSVRDQPAKTKAAHAESPATRAFRCAVEHAVIDGMDPNDVAKIVIAAIKNNQFWIFTHSHVPETALRQATQMAERNVLIDL
jgi:NAD(P)-dependent dehydrogenase (short-subunit alcohol dehydrogenase family)